MEPLGAGAEPDQLLPPQILLGVYTKGVEAYPLVRSICEYKAYKCSCAHCETAKADTRERILGSHQRQIIDSPPTPIPTRVGLRTSIDKVKLYLFQIDCSSDSWDPLS